MTSGAPSLPVIRADIAAEVRGQARAEAAGGERTFVLCVPGALWVFGCDWLAPEQSGGATRQPVNDVHVFLKL